MLHILLALSFLSLLSFSSITHASDLSALLKQAEDKQLASDPYWLALLHFRSNDKGGGSEIVSDSFFLSKNGRFNASDELKATLSAMVMPIDVDVNQHAQCRFVARYQWLKKMLVWPQILSNQVACPDYDRWSLNGEIESLSLIFASGYMGNPASFYGHLLLKFNSNRSLITNDLMDQSINFGAIVPENESPLIYIYRGIFGSYDAAFSHTKFFRQNHMYAESELRDMWEYELELSEEEVAQIVAHSWELMGQHFIYYFHDENCAYQMAELLQLVVKDPLLNEYLPWSLPSSIIDNMTTIKRRGLPLIRDVKLIPSRQTRFYAKYYALSQKQQTTAEILLDSDLDLKIPIYQQLSSAEKSQLLEVLFDYFEYRIAEVDDDAIYRERKHKLLIERFSLPAKMRRQGQAYSALAPHHSPKPSLLRVSGLHSNTFGYGLEFQARPTYFDTLALDQGRIASSHISMFDLRLVYLNQQIKLRSLDIVNIETLNLSKTPLQGDGGKAWKIKFGFENPYLDCLDCLRFSLNGGLGKALSLGSKNILYGMLEGGLEMPGYNQVMLTGIVRLAFILNPTEEWKVRLSAGRHYSEKSRRDGQDDYQLESRWGKSRDWDFRFSYQDYLAREVKIGLSRYW